MEFSCFTEGCPFEGPGSYVVTIAPEAFIDENNYATIFCPHCQNEMIKMEYNEDDTNN
jgi:hypothetical protein